MDKTSEFLTLMCWPNPIEFEQKYSQSSEYACVYKYVSINVVNVQLELRMGSSLVILSIFEGSSRPVVDRWRLLFYKLV